MILSESVRAVVERLPAGWQIMSFGEVLAEPVRNGIYKSKEFHGRGARVVNMGELFGHDFISDQEMKRVELTDDEKSKSSLKDGDLLFARRSLVFEGSGKCSIVVNPPELTTFESSIIRARPNRGIAEPRFLFYLFASPVGRAIVASIATRTAVSGIRGSDLWQVGLPLPPLPAQRRIAGVLSAYDELIENNQRRIQILETMARAVYREWFVEFRFPGHDKIPRVASPLGDIPQGWEVKKLKDVCHLTMGQSPKSEFYNQIGEGQPFHQGVTDFSDRFPTDRLFCTVEGRVAEAGDILFSVRAPVGRMNIADKRIVLGRGLSAIRHNEGHQAFLWEQLRNRFSKDDMMGNGAIFAAVTKGDMQGIELVCPPSALVGAAAKHFEPINSQIGALTKKIHNLRRTRDLLLPRLLSGQVALTDTAA